MADEDKTAQTEESRPAEIGSQETTPTPKEDAQPQETVVEKVEPTATTQAPETPRARPSDFYKERQAMRTLREHMASHSKQIEDMASMLKEFRKQPEVPESKFNPDEFFADPNKILTAREKALREEIGELKKQVGQFQEFTTRAEQADFQKKSQESLELLFPKTSEDDMRSPQDRALDDNARTQKIWNIVEKFKLHNQIDTAPKETVELILGLMGKGEGKQDPTVIPKKAMGGSARGGGSQGKAPTAKEQKRLELKRLMDEAENNTDLRLNDEHKMKRQRTIRELELLEKE